MIPELSLPEYYLQSAEIDVDPAIGETVVGVMGTDLEVESPTLSEDPEGFQCRASLTLLLFYDEKAPWEMENDEEVETFGTVDTEFSIYIPGEIPTIQPYVEEWQSSEKYHVTDREFRHHLESGILQYLIDPIGDLLENSYNGIVPRISFTHQAE